ncbi:MAG: hypothetical protein ACLPQS_07680 [Acidimicrobiales bacterium]
MPSVLSAARSARSAGTMSASLAVVEQSLLAEAEGRADSIVEAARSDAAAEVARARSYGQRLIEQARAEGTSAAGRAAETALALAEGEAMSFVLAARRRGYEALRLALIEELTGKLRRGEVSALESRLAAIVRRRAGTGAIVRGALGDPSGLVATSGNRSASVTIEALVDHALASADLEIEALSA